VVLQAAEVGRRSDGCGAVVRAQPVGTAGQGHGHPAAGRIGADRRRERSRSDGARRDHARARRAEDQAAPEVRLRDGGRDEAAGGGGEDVDTGTATSTDYRSRNAVGEGIKKYLTAHPEIRGVFWGQGGSTGLRRQLYPMQDKFLGTFVTDNVYTLQSQMSTYPGDVWQLAEEQLLEPLVHVDRMEAKDPEGLDVWSDITEDMAERWAAGAYQRGHLYMFPNQ